MAKNKRILMTVKIDPDIKRRAKMACLRLDITLQDLVQTLIKRWLKNMEGAGKGDK